MINTHGGVLLRREHQRGGGTWWALLARDPKESVYTSIQPIPNWFNYRAPSLGVVRPEVSNINFSRGQTSSERQRDWRCLRLAAEIYSRGCEVEFKVRWGNIASKPTHFLFLSELRPRINPWEEHRCCQGTFDLCIFKLFKCFRCTFLTAHHSSGFQQNMRYEIISRRRSVTASSHVKR